MMKQQRDQWYVTEIVGVHKDPEYVVKESVLHRESADPVVMACRRNREMAACDEITAGTAEAFAVYREKETGRRKAEIPRMGNQDEEWDF